MDENHIAPAAPQPEIVDLTTSTTPEPEIAHQTAVKRNKSKFDIWSLPPAWGSANALRDVKQNQVSLQRQLMPSFVVHHIWSWTAQRTARLK
jgi:hypothetical protein